MTAVRPPEYWPRPIFFALADHADRMILGDTMQYSRQSYQNRTRVRTPQQWQWMSIPLMGGQHGEPIGDVRIHGPHRWIRKHWRALHFNYRTSPFFDYFEPRLETVLNREWNVLGDLTCATVEVLAELLGIVTPIERASDLEGRPREVEGILTTAGDRLLLSGEDAANANQPHAPEMQILRLDGFAYRQNFEGFEPGMSTLDLLFNYGPQTLSMIRRAVVVEGAGVTSRGSDGGI